MKTKCLLFILVCQFVFSRSFAGDTTSVRRQTQVSTSYIAMPISLNYKEIDGIIDKQMKGVLFEDSSYDDNNHDDTKTKVVKDGAMKMLGLTNGVQIEIPLRIWYSRRVGFYEIATDFDMTLVITSKISLGASWNIISQSTMKSYTITRDPVLKVAGAGIDVKYVVQFCIDQFLPDILKDIDKNFAQTDMLRKQATEVWRNIQQPVVIDTPVRTWIRVVPQALYMEPLKYYRDEIDINAAMEAFIYTGIGYPRPKMDEPFKDVIFKDKLENNFRLQIGVDLPYTEMSGIATRMFADTTFAMGRKKTFKVTNVQITGTDSTITTSVKTEGDINTFISFTGKPAFIDSSEVFYLGNFDYTMESGQFLLRMADRFFNEKIRRSFEQAMHFSLAEQMATARRTISTFLSDYKLFNKVMITGKLDKFALNGICSDSLKVSTLFDVQGQARVRLLNLGE